MSDSAHGTTPSFGQSVYDEEGNELGRVRGFGDSGFYVTLDEGIEGLSEEHVKSGQEFGEAELMWRCWACGEMGEIDEDIPEACPSCGAEKEDIYYWTED